MKLAVCVGINDYPGTINDLNGCVNDANDWAWLLANEFEFNETRVLLDSSATKENILAELDWLVSSATEGDVVVFTYSGHGTQVSDENNDEEDFYDEALYVYDTYIIDDELRSILDRLHPDATAYLVIDSCFSGTSTRVMAFGQTPKPKFVQTHQVDRKVLRKNLLQEEEMTELLLTGSSDSEYAYDAYFGGKYNGAMTYFALTTMYENLGASWEDFYTKLRENLPSTSYPQTPQLEGKEELKQRVLFEATEVAPEPPTQPPDPPELPGDACWILSFIREILAWLVDVLDGFLHRR